RRAAVRLTRAALSSDPLGAAFVPGAPLTASGPLDVTEIEWSNDEALPVSIQITETIVDSEAATSRFVDSAVARGNVVLADHGRTVVDAFTSPPLPFTTVPPHTSTTPAEDAI